MGNVALEADPTTGKLYIVGHDSNISSYEVDSFGGKLHNVAPRGQTAAYNTLAAQSVAGLPGSALGLNEPFWNVISSGSPTDPLNYVAEGVTNGQATTFDIIRPELQVFDLNTATGSAWTAGVPVSDLFFKYGNGTSATLQPAVIDLAATPEPTTLSLLGLGAMGLMARRRKSRDARRKMS